MTVTPVPTRRDKPFDLMTWGETMVRLAAPDGVPLEETERLEFKVGGTESNVAINLAWLGWRTGWASRLPANPLGRRVVREVRAHGVDVSGVLWAPEAGLADGSGGRAGLYFIDPGVPPRPIEVIYDREHTAIAYLLPDQLDYALLSSARILHLTGITPALSDGCRQAWLHSAEHARAAGSRVSVDVNYRAKLWSPAQARATLEAVLPMTDVLFCGMADARLVFGVGGGAADSPEQAARALAERYTVPLVVLTLGADGALAYHHGDASTLRCPVYPTQVMDRIGSGDAFASGFLLGWAGDAATDDSGDIERGLRGDIERGLHGDIERGLRYGNALAALKQTYRGDVAWCTRAQLLALAESQGTDPRSIAR